MTCCMIVLPVFMGGGFSFFFLFFVNENWFAIDLPG